MKRAVFCAADQVARLHMIVKPHPLEDVRETRRFLGKGRNVTFVDAADDIRELTKACDAFLGFGSTATVDALIANKLVVCPVFPGWVWSDTFVKSNATLVPRSEQQVTEVFRSIVNGSCAKLMAELEPARQFFLERMAHRTDGRSAERIAAMAVKMTVKSNLLCPM